MTGAGHPRRVVIMGPTRSDESLIVTVAEKRLQPVLPVTCCGVSNVIVGTDEGDAVAAAAPERRQVLPTSASDEDPARGSAGAPPGGVGCAAEATLAPGVESAAAAGGAAALFAQPKPSASKTPESANVRMAPF